jgi:hypothetical protein
MNTNRLIFNSLDLSASIPQPGDITGFTVVKAPKGTTYPTYFAPNNTTGLLNHLGNPSSTYPGIQEVLDFNSAGYGVWVSAPPGSYSNPAGASYNSANPSALNAYFGGVYITKRGTAEQFYQVGEDSQSKPSHNFKILVTSGATVSGGTLSNSYSVGSTVPTYSSNTITVDLLPAAVATSAVTGVILSYTRPDSTTATITFTLSVAGATRNLVAVNPYDNTSTITLTGALSASSTTGLYKILIPTNGSASSSISNYTTVDPVTGTTYYDLYFAGTLDTWLTGAGLASIRVKWIQNISTEAIMSICQSSVRSTPGTLAITKIDATSTTYPVFNTPFTLSGTASVVGTVLLKNSYGTTLGTYTATNATIGYVALATDIATYFTSTAPISGYTVTANSGVVTVTTQNNGTWGAPTLTKGTGLTGITVVAGNSAGSGTATTNPNYNTVSYTYDEVSYTGGANFTSTGKLSPDPTKTDGLGGTLYAEDVLSGNQYIHSTVFGNGQIYDMLSAGTASTTYISGNRPASDLSAYTNSGTIQSAILSNLLVNGWGTGTGSLVSEVSVAFDPEMASGTTASLMASLYASALQFTTFLTGVRTSVSAPTGSGGNQSVINDLITLRSALPNVIGLNYYCNEFLVKENYSSTQFYSTPIGAMSAMFAKIMRDRMGGLAPMWINENDMGGQINKSVKKAKYSFDAGDLDSLDAVGLNPIILDTKLGLMATSARTAQSPVMLTDNSYSGHAMSFAMFKKEVRDAVMLPQLGKYIDTYYLTLREQQTNNILDSRTKGPLAIWSDGKVLVQEVNTSQTKAQNKFIIQVRVKVKPFSEYVTLSFINVGQQSTVG